MTGEAAESLIAARRRDSNRRRQRVLSVLDQIAAVGQEISVSAVARTAGVYRLVPLTVTTICAPIFMHGLPSPSCSPASTAASKQSLLADLANLREQNQRLRRQNTDLTARLSEVLGEEVFRPAASDAPTKPRRSGPASASWNSRCSTCARNSKNEPTTSPPPAPPTATSCRWPTGNPPASPSARVHQPRRGCPGARYWAATGMTRASTCPAGRRRRGRSRASRVRDAGPFPFPFLQASQVLRRHQAGDRLGVPGQDDPLMAVGNPVDQLCKLFPRLGHRNLARHGMRLCTFWTLLK